MLDVESHDGGSGSYTILTLANSSGTIATAPIWLKDQRVVEGVEPGQCVQVIGQVTRYRSTRQLSVTSLRRLPEDSGEWRRLMPSAGDPDRFWGIVERWRSDLSSGWSRIVSAVYDDDELRHRLTECPQSCDPRTAYLGGLLRHVVELGAVARALARVRRADMDLVMTGVLLHEVGKLEAYRWEKGIVEVTEAGRLIGTQVLSLQLVRRRWQALEPAPFGHTERELFDHLVLAQPDGDEPGAVRAATLEARIVAAAHAALSDSDTA